MIGILNSAVCAYLHVAAIKLQRAVIYRAVVIFEKTIPSRSYEHPRVVQRIISHSISCN